MKLNHFYNGKQIKDSRIINRTIYFYGSSVGVSNTEINVHLGTHNVFVELGNIDKHGFKHGEILSLTKTKSYEKIRVDNSQYSSLLLIHKRNQSKMLFSWIKTKYSNIEISDFLFSNCQDGVHILTYNKLKTAEETFKNSLCYVAKNALLIDKNRTFVTA